MKSFISIIIFSASIKSLLACGCIGTSTIENQYEYADIVFSGTVIEKEEFWLLDSSMFEIFGFAEDSIINKNKRMYGRYFYKYYFKSDFIYKGKSKSDTIIISTGFGSGDCGYKFKLDQKYIVYANYKSYSGDFHGRTYSNGNKICWTDICLRTQLYDIKEIENINKIKNGN